ncbi:MAG: host attachment protein, partial [Gammaproteobacteria bacterium]|nr:host attachment protein [Gammaproteobacteria bacterium]
MPEIYVIVVDSSKAQVLHSTGKTSPLIETIVFDHPEGRMHTRDLTSDLPGRDSNRTGLGKHKMDSGSDPKQRE